MIVSFDFDDTIMVKKKSKGGKEESERICPWTRSQIEKEKEAGNKVIIVTSRYGPDPAFGYDNKDVFSTAKQLSIGDVYFTQGEKKVEILLDLGVEKHYDNDQSELDAIEKHPKSSIKVIKHVAGEKKEPSIKIMIRKMVLQELEAYQRKIRKNYVKKRNKYLSGGSQKKGGAPYTIAPKQTRSKSAPAGFGGAEE
jgi:hydroxymethylpyrimidine pyrophosphatase-like HAD family hydrolase